MAISRKARIWSVVISVVVVTGILFFVFPRWLTWTASQPLADEFSSVVENREAWTDHRTVVNWIAQCVGVHAPENLPEAKRIAMETPYRTFFVGPEETPTGNFTTQHYAVHGLSSALFLERTNGAERANQAFKSLERIQVATILIGLITTVLISLSSTDLLWESLKSAVKILAIVFPAVGTALAALNAFYDPKNDLIRYGRNADAARQIHRQLALGVWELSCTSDPKSAEWQANKLQIDQWITTHKSLLTPSKSDTSGGQDGVATTDPKGVGGKKPAQ